MARLTHKPEGWRVVEDETYKDEKGQDQKRERPLSCLAFDAHTEALAYVAAAFPDCKIESRCDCCGKVKDLEPEPVSRTFMLTCKGCRSVPATFSPPSDAEQGKPCKKPRVIHEVDRDGFLRETLHDVRRFEMATTGVESVDKALRLPMAPKAQPATDAVIGADEAPAECQLCEIPLGGHFIDGVVRGGGWGYMCVHCHKLHGIGFGTGRGQLYARDNDGSYFKVSP